MTMPFDPGLNSFTGAYSAGTYRCVAETTCPGSWRARKRAALGPRRDRPCTILLFRKSGFGVRCDNICESIVPTLCGGQFIRFEGAGIQL
jgi:hypothetical protein